MKLSEYHYKVMAIVEGEYLFSRLHKHFFFLNKVTQLFISQTVICKRENNSNVSPRF